ncbi:MAG: hypothetical protein E7035_03760 [Verrucomicrobiaceae bacterium]|nr:hypothetical protein [Verrucomicrobiaceae bacterium]
MFYLLLIVGIIGFSLWVELKKEVNHEVEPDDIEPFNPPSRDTVDRRSVRKKYNTADETEYSEDFENARDFVEQLKRKRSSTKTDVSPQFDNSFDEPELDYQEPATYSNIPNKNVGRNYVDKALVCKSIEQMERETAEIQARAIQTLQEIEQMNASVKTEKNVETEVQPEFKSAFFKDNNDLRRAFVVSEILSKPLSLRK